MPRNPARPSHCPETADLKSLPAPRGGFRWRAISLGVLAVATVPSPAAAGDFEPEARLVRCDTQSCLEVSGYRDHPASVVALNGHVVSAEGSNGWRVRLPVETVRQWSAPFARTIEVSLRNPETDRETVASADLPIGLLGDVTQLALLEVRAR